MSTKELPIERLLRHAQHERGLRPEFYRRLLDSSVIVPIRQQSGRPQCGGIAAGTTVEAISLVRVDGLALVPFFTSATPFFSAFPNGHGCIVMPVRELFGSREDMPFCLNPFSKYGRDFYPIETQSLLTIGGLLPPWEPTIPIDEDVVLRSPEIPPRGLLEALRVLFARSLEVKTAYLAQLGHPRVADQSLLLVLDLREGCDGARIQIDTGTIIAELDDAVGMTIEVMALSHDDSEIARYCLNEARPFYEMGVASRLLGK